MNIRMLSYTSILMPSSFILHFGNIATIINHVDLHHNLFLLDKSLLLSFQVPTITSSIFSKSFKEWKYCQYEIRNIKLTNFMECPCCTVSQHSCHVDGNCKLYRFKSAGG